MTNTMASKQSVVGASKGATLVKLLTCDFTPFGCLVACQLHMHDEVQSAGGVIMPDGSESVVQSPTATVLAVGPECKQVKPYDEIVFLNNAQGGWITHNRQKIMMCREEAIVAIVEKGKESALHRRLVSQRDSKTLSVAG